MSTELLTTAEAATRLGLTVRAIQKMIEGGRLPARKVGRDYLIDPSALEDIPKQAVGRPPKAQPATKTTRKLNAAFREATEAEAAGKKKGGKR